MRGGLHGIREAIVRSFAKGHLKEGGHDLEAPILLALMIVRAGVNRYMETPSSFPLLKSPILFR